MLEQKQMYNIWLVIICRLWMIQDLNIHDSRGLGYLRAFTWSKGLSPQNHHLESRHGQWQSAINSWPLRFVPVLNAWWFNDSTAVSWLEILCGFNVLCETEYACHLGSYCNSPRVRPYSSDWRSDKSEVN